MFSPNDNASTIFALFKVATQSVCKEAIRVPLINQAARLHKQLCSVQYEIEKYLSKGFLGRMRASKKIASLKQQFTRLKEKFFQWIFGSVNTFGLGNTVL